MNKVIITIENFIKDIHEIGDSILFFNITGISYYKIPFLVAWIAIGGLYFCIKFKFINIRYLFQSVKYALSSKIEDLQIKSKNYQNHNTFSTSKKIILTGIGEAIDVSAIFGVTMAVIIGGPGVLFWMFIGALLSMPIRFVEVALAHKTRKVKKTGEIIGGPDRYISLMFKVIKMPKIGKYIAGLFSICVILSTFASPQMNQTINIVRYIIPASENYILYITILCAISIFYILFSGFRKITIIVSKMVRVMSILYIITCLLIIGKHYENLLPSVSLIFSQAFNLKAIEGSIFFIIITGLKRTFFSCDVGQGVASIGHVNSANSNSVQEGIMSMCSIFLITLVAIFCSGMIVIITNSYLNYTDSMSAVIHAFNTVHPLLKYLLFIVVPMFAITTAVSWGYFGQRAWKSLIGKKSVFIYNIILFCAYICCGTIKDFSMILNITDILNLSIAFPNMIALIIGSNLIYKRYKKYINKD